MKRKFSFTLLLLLFVFSKVIGFRITENDDSLLYYKIKADELKYSDTIFSKLYCQKLIYRNNLKENEEYTFYGYQILGDLYKNIGRYSLALENYFLALDNASKTQDVLQVSKIYDQLARIYLETGSKNQMHESLEKALKMKENLIDKSEYYRSKLILSGYYRRTGNYLQALSIGYESLDYFEHEEDTLNIAFSCNYLALAYKELKSFNKAKQYYQKAKEIYQNTDNNAGYSRILNNLGNIELESKNYQEALNYYQQSLEIEKRLNNKFAILTRYNNVGLAFAYLGNYSAAIDKFRYCINEYKKANSLINLANIYNSLAICYNVMQEYDSSIIYYKRSIDLCKTSS